MDNKCYIGIDVGSRGFICVQYNGIFKHYSIEDNDLYQLSEIMADIRNKHENIACVIEDVHSIFGSSAKSTFNFGFNKGYLIGLLSANRIPYTLVAPKEWQKAMWTNADMVYKYEKVKIKGEEKIRKTIDTKATSIKAAKRLFPNIDFRKSERCKNLDDNKVDATLMCEYARRKNL